MRSLLVYLSLFSLVLSPVFLPGEQAREITWDDLLPKEEATFDDPFEKLSEEQLLDLGMIARIRFLLQNEKIKPDGPDAAEEKKLVAKLAGEGIDVDWLLSQRERVAGMRRKRAESVDESVDGKAVRVPGYMLPLKREEKGVTEFLLVPWVGACIHTPPPPPNQMVHATVPDGTEDRGRFAPVWLEGTLQLKPSTYDLFLVDGTNSVNVAYTMTAEVITDYSSAESDTLAKVEIPEEAFAGHSWWQRMQAKVSILFTKTMTDIRDRRTSGPLFWGLLVAFLYGVVHTLGPGHGKAVVISYFVGEGGSVGKGIGMGIQIAVFHVLSAVLIVVVTDFAVRQATGKAPSDYRTVRLISYGGIILIGLWMLRGAMAGMRLKHDHDSHEEGGHDHGHAHHAGCAACDALATKKGKGGWLSLAVGAVPCTGALLVLLYGLANDLLWSAVLMVVAISLGMAITLSSLGVAAVLGRRYVDRKLGADLERQQRVANRLRVAGASVIFLIGVALFSTTWVGSGILPGASSATNAEGKTPEKG